jgi:DNA helicase-2/ATP-dependent DNA helicase PcrA
MESSEFIAEINETQPLPAEKIFLNEDVKTLFQLQTFENNQPPQIQSMEEDLISRLLDKFVMNVTALNNYLRCPLEFYYQNLIRIPFSKNEAAEFGSAVHFALQRLFEKMKNNNNVFGSAEDFENDFIWYMRRHRESFTKEQFKRRLEYGHDVLINYYNKYIHSWNKITVVERNIRNVIVNDVPLKGKLDKLEFSGKDVNVVDYKTGDAERAAAKLLPPNEKEPNGGDYWRQAVFYKILIDGYEQKQWNVISTEFDFVEPDKKKAYRKIKIDITEADTTTVKQQIVTVREKIQRREFYTGCGKEDCKWCNFVRTNNLAGN